MPGLWLASDDVAEADADADTEADADADSDEDGGGDGVREALTPALSGGSTPKPGSRSTPWPPYVMGCAAAYGGRHRCVYADAAGPCAGINTG